LPEAPAGEKVTEGLGAGARLIVTPDGKSLGGSAR
jgi:hypothetical protein